MTQPVDHTSGKCQLAPKCESLQSQRRTHTDLGGIIRGTKNELWCTVISRADVGDVRLVLNQNLCAAEIAELEYAGCRVQEQVLWLDVAMADALGVDVGERAEELVDVQLHL